MGFYLSHPCELIIAARNTWFFCGSL